MSEFFQLVKDLQASATKLEVATSGNSAQPGSISYDLKRELNLVSALVNPRKSYQTHASLLSSPPALENGQYPLVEIWNDTDKTKNGLYGHDGTAWIKSQFDALELMQAMGPLRRNAGADYPLSLKTRGAITSPRNVLWNDFLLDMQVYGAVDGEYYKVSYFQNNATIGSYSGYDFCIEAHKKTDFDAGNDVFEKLMWYGGVDSAWGAQPQLLPNTGVQVLTIQIPSRNWMRFLLIVDTDALPANNGTINSLSSAKDGYSWVVDESCCYVTGQPVSYLENSSGIDFPFLSIERNGTVSENHEFFRDGVLDVKVIGAEVGKYYRLAYYKNGVEGLGGGPYGWIVEEFDKSNYSAQASGVKVLNYTDDAPEVYGDGMIHTVELMSSSRLGLSFQITYDSSKLPAFGTRISSTSSADDGYSWVINPSQYSIVDPLLAQRGPLESNSGINYPFLFLERGGTSPEIHDFFRDGVLDVKVLGAEPDKYYRLAYYKNGVEGLSGGPYGWVVEVFDKAAYATEGSAVRVITFDEDMPEIYIDDGIHTVELVSKTYRGLSFQVTYDSSKLPAFGTKISSLLIADPGYSWIINPSQYFIRSGGSNTDKSMFVNIVSGAVSFEFEEAGSAYRLSIRPNGANDLPNIRSVEVLKNGIWELQNTASTDWLPPMVFSALNNGSAHNKVYTGGNHRSNGDSTGDRTALNKVFNLYLDGKLTSLDTDAVFSCTSAKIIIVNELMGYNTIPLARYALRQAFNLNITSGTVEVLSKVKALEDILVETDNGPQTVTMGARDSMLLIDGDISGRVIFDNELDSGPSLGNSAWAAVFKGPDLLIGSWMDRSYGIGNGAYVDDDKPYIRGGGSTNTKFYNAAIRSTTATFLLGAEYEWRGGYFFGSPVAPSADVDSICHLNNKESLVVFSDSDYLVM